MSFVNLVTTPFAAIGKELSVVSSRLHESEAPAVARAAAALVAALREQLSLPGTGRVYRLASVRRDGSVARTKKGKRSYRTHRASAPGQSPAVFYGELRRGVTFGLVGGVMRVGPTAKYAVWLDKGTFRMRPRPFMAPALARASATMVAESVSVIVGGLYGL